MPEPVLQVRGLSKSFGGVIAVNDVSLDVQLGELHAVIGPNGAGKTTLINLISGDLPADTGSILFCGDDIARLAPERRSRLGLGRSYQKVNIFSGFSALENCRLAAQSRDPRPLHWFRNALSYEDILGSAHRALTAVGLVKRADVIAGTLSHGEQRQLEIAMALATDPQLLLLDEPLAGLGAEETATMVTLISEVAANHAVLLVEHDLDAVFRLARVLTVMVNGRVLASAAPEIIRANRDVQSAYLGSLDALI